MRKVMLAVLALLLLPLSLGLAQIRYTSPGLVGDLNLGGTGTIYGSLAVVNANTGALTTTAAQSGYVFTNTGDADGSSVTFMNNPTIGINYSVVVTAAQTITVAPSAGETLYLNAAACANVTSSTLGAALSVVAVVGGSGGVFVASGSGWTCN